MSEKDARILDVFAQLIPKLDEKEKATILAFGEGMAFVVGQRRAEEERESA